MIAGTHGCVPISVGAFTHRSRPAELFRRRKRLNMTVAGNRPRDSSAMCRSTELPANPRPTTPKCCRSALLTVPPWLR